jgi:DNA-binding response OmpR family regulator
MAFQTIDSITDDRGRLLSLVGDEDLREAIRYWSTDLGLTVDTVCSGARAAKLLRKVEYQALVTDRVIPPWPGLDSLPKLKRQYPDLRVIVLLRRGPVGVASLLRLVGADEVIEGPMRVSTLVSALRLEPKNERGSCPAAGR